ncbi:uncharacterized protein LOC109863283 [Pseudomyrmex gracilis]|uniref:uncharacterized protein LOC109863283 n=1 Tax=Pseudomyrmex gracilis TaxID=219809 RepID=UPI0009949117|nr:uncharacterized protein LOC109863283 [Pseudomyrmex gracilis]
MAKKQDTTICLNDDETLSSKATIRIPAFWPEDPELWFAQLESQFAICEMKSDEAKYAYVLSKLEPRQAREVKDVITQPPSGNKYAAIKKALIQRLTDSQEQRIRQLLEQEELGDRKPSQFLRHLQTLAGTTVSDRLLRTLWLGRLPSQVQAILATRAEDELSSVAEQADRIHEISNRAVVLATTPHAAAAVATQATTTATTTTCQIKALTKQVAALTAQMAKLMKQDRARSRSRSRSRPRRGEYRDKDICYYHRRFGAEARRCAQPCAFKKKNEEGSH